MTKNQSLIFRIVLFLLGAAIIALAFFLFGNGSSELSQNDKFIWASIAIMYIVFFCPFFFSKITIGNFSVKIPNLALVWTALVFYIVISIGIIALLKTSHISFNTALVIQAILFFLLAISVYFAYFAQTHVQNVAAEEAHIRQNLSEAKTKAASLLINVQNLNGQYESVQKTILRTLDDIKYLSPVSNDSELELKIIALLNLLSMHCETIAQGGHAQTIENDANNLQMLVKQRKLIRN
ncbi:MAG: hypothetical protein LBV52_00850 [Spirochaetaceae bacterium]|jgi:hypothetical protein|nr:hypothetical protein [Spirochaetaceae bacterium]